MKIYLVAATLILSNFVNAEEILIGGNHRECYATAVDAQNFSYDGFSRRTEKEARANAIRFCTKKSVQPETCIIDESQTPEQCFIIPNEI